MNIQRSYAESAGQLDWTRKKMPFVYRFVRKIATWKMKQDHFGQVIPLEDAEKIIDLAGSVTRLPCVCRGATRGHLSSRYCMALGIDPVGILGDYPDLRSSLETLTPQQAKGLLREFDQEGLIHSVWTFKTPFIGGICNCDRDCMAYRTQVTADLMQVMFKAEYIAYIEPAECIGCGTAGKSASLGL